MSHNSRHLQAIAVHCFLESRLLVKKNSQIHHFFRKAEGSGSNHSPAHSPRASRPRAHINSYCLDLDTVKPRVRAAYTCLIALFSCTLSTLIHGHTACTHEILLHRVRYREAITRSSMHTSARFSPAHCPRASRPRAHMESYRLWSDSLTLLGTSNLSPQCVSQWLVQRRGKHRGWR